MDECEVRKVKKLFMTDLACFGLMLYVVFLFRNGFTPVYEFPVISFLLFPWFISIVLITQKQEWGRKLMVVISAFMCFYLAATPIYQNRSISLILIIFVLMIYYILPKTKTQFKGRGEGHLGSNKKILVVDDDKGLLKVLRANLMSHGFSVITADTGEKGLQLAGKKKPDLIILDVLLPGIKGREVCAKIKKNKLTSRIPVLFLTAKDSPDDVKAEMAAGALGHLTKPVDPKELIAEIKNILYL